MARRVQARDEHGRVGEEETLVVIRRQEESDKTVVDYYLSSAPIETPLAEFARAATAHHRVEECFQRAKSEAGLADYEVRTYHGWYHHQTMSLMALWFLVEGTGRKKKGDACIDGSSSPLRDLLTAARGLRLPYDVPNRRALRTPTATEPNRTALSLETA
jgi:hypothetical protein